MNITEAMNSQRVSADLPLGKTSLALHRWLLAPGLCQLATKDEFF